VAGTSDRLGIVSPAKAGFAVIQDPMQIATEGALWGSIHAHGFLQDAVVLSDDAGQFDIGQHALCWVHAERSRRHGRISGQMGAVCRAAIKVRIPDNQDEKVVAGLVS
jgi:hypothetical protein